MPKYVKLTNCPKCGDDLLNLHGRSHLRWCHVYQKVKNLNWNDIQIKYDNWEDLDKFIIK